MAGSQQLTQSSASGADDPLATALEKYALASEKVGEARLAQDAQIQQRFLAGWSTTLNTNLMFATRARRGVESARLGLDAAKSKGKTGGARGMNPDDEMMSEEARAEVEQKEDEFVGQTEEAVGVMKNVYTYPILFWQHEGSLPKQGRRQFQLIVMFKTRSLIHRSLCEIWRI